MIKIKVDKTEVELNLDGHSSMVCAEATVAIETLIDIISEALNCSFDMAMEKAIDIIKAHKGSNIRKIKEKEGDFSAGTNK